MAPGTRVRPWTVFPPRRPEPRKTHEWQKAPKYDANVDVIDIFYPQEEAPGDAAPSAVTVHSPAARSSVHVTS